MRKKIYGQSMRSSCPFCQEIALYKNKENIPVCAKHKESLLGNKKCFCGSSLEIKESKWGPFFLCGQCGPLSFKKVLE